MVAAMSNGRTRARISSLATYVPPRVLTNADLEKMVDTNDEWILQRTGIRERHLVDPGVATSDLAAEAAREAIARAGLTPADIDFIVVGTTTPDMLFPSTACLLQAKIGAVNAWGYDLFAACSGFTYALTTAAQMIAGGGSRRALVVGADVMSSIIDYTDRATCVIFGDGAGAAVVSSRPREGARSVRWRAGESLHAPKHRDALRFEQRGGMLRNILTLPVPKLAGEHARKVLDAALAHEGVARRDVSGWVMHAGGRRVLAELQDRLGLTAGDVTTSAAVLDEYGNLSSPFVLFVLKAALDARAQGGLWWMSSFGAGFSCHGALLEVA